MSAIIAASTGASAAAVAASAVAASAARRQHEAECTLLMETYDAKTATIEQAQNYAECVQTLAPVDTDGMRIIVAILLGAAAIGAGIGAAANPNYDRLGAAIAGFVLGLAGAGVGMLLIRAIVFVATGQ